MACIIFLLDSTAAGWRFSDCGWYQNDRGHLVRIPRPRPYPASRSLGLPFFIGSPGLNPLLWWGGPGECGLQKLLSASVWSLWTQKKAMPRDRQDFSAWLRPGVDFAGVDCSDRVGEEKRREKGGSGELCLVKGV